MAGNESSKSLVDYTEDNLRRRYLNSLGTTVGLAGTTAAFGAFSAKEYLEGNTELAGQFLLTSVVSAGAAKSHHKFIYQTIKEEYSKIKNSTDTDDILEDSFLEKEDYLQTWEETYRNQRHEILEYLEENGETSEEELDAALDREEDIETSLVNLVENGLVRNSRHDERRVYTLNNRITVEKLLDPEVHYDDFAREVEEEMRPE